MNERIPYDDLVRSKHVGLFFNKSVLSDFNVTEKQVHELVQVKLLDKM